MEIGMGIFYGCAYAYPVLAKMKDNIAIINFI